MAGTESIPFVIKQWLAGKPPNRMEVYSWENHRTKRWVFHCHCKFQQSRGVIHGLLATSEMLWPYFSLSGLAGGLSEFGEQRRAAWSCRNTFVKLNYQIRSPSGVISIAQSQQLKTELSVREPQSIKGSIQSRCTRHNLSGQHTPELLYAQPACSALTFWVPNPPQIIGSRNLTGQSPTIRINQDDI